MDEGSFYFDAGVGVVSAENVELYQDPLPHTEVYPAWSVHGTVLGRWSQAGHSVFEELVSCW